MPFSSISRRAKQCLSLSPSEVLWLTRFQRNYRAFSALSFAIVLTAIWEYLMLTCAPGLEHGGLAGLFWSYIWTFVGFTFVEMSLAEMASM